MNGIVNHIAYNGQQFGQKKALTANSTCGKLVFQWLIDHQISYHPLRWIDSLLLRNPYLRQSLKRYTYFDKNKIMLHLKYGCQST